MLPFELALVLILQTRSAVGLTGSDLATAALASPRPRDCRGAGAGDGLWARARAGDAQRYCELLARGYARLEQTPAEALVAAEAAAALAGNLAPVRVLKGRAQLRLGQAPAAFEQFSRAESEDTQAFLDPKALHDYARSASLAGQAQAALRLYRVLVSRSALLDDLREKTLVQIEAAAHVLAYAPGGADEALGYLAQARRDALGLSPWINALRWLTAERTGRNERMRDAHGAPSLATLTAPLSGISSQAPLLPPGELDALGAALVESVDPTQAREHWAQFLAHAGPDNVWLAQARKKHGEPVGGKGKAR